MAKEDEKKPTTAAKGKGKAVSAEPEKKEKKEEVKRDKDGKPIEGDKKGKEPTGA
jgi:26S proteasome regulatory subunit N1